jgi:exosortase/archaeosortase family protein
MKRTFSYKKIFGTIFIALSIILVILPFANTFNEFLTRIVENTPIYKFLEAYLVPYMSVILFVLLSHLPALDVKAIPQGVVVNGTDVIVNWNCLGWQSYILFFASLLVGLQGGNFGKRSVVLAVSFGLSGTFLINIFRMVFTAALVGWWKGLFVILFHNYFAAFLTILWLFFFWWFAYKYILEERSTVIDTHKE